MPIDQPKTPAIDLERIEFACRPILIKKRDEQNGVVRRWLEVTCDAHDDFYWCSHHHRRWGPIVRCMDRHVRTSAD